MSTKASWAIPAEFGTKASRLPQVRHRFGLFVKGHEPDLEGRIKSHVVSLASPTQRAGRRYL